MGILSSKNNGLLVGVGVGFSDTAMLYPMMVLATRREAGASLPNALKAGKYWSGGLTYLSLGIPYSMVVASLPGLVQGPMRDAGVPMPELASSLITAAVLTNVLNPLEKKLTMDQLLQSGAYKMANVRKNASKNVPRNANSSFMSRIPGPVGEVIRYASAKGFSSLLAGYRWQLAREMIYVLALAEISPMAVEYVGGGDSLAGACALSFAIGGTAGMISAPFQTLNAMAKDERNLNTSTRNLIREQVFHKGVGFGIKRLFYGSAIRSGRIGCAGILYYGWRQVVEAVTTEDDYLNA